MNKSLQEWKALLGSAFPSGANAYWRVLPVGRTKSLLVGTFFISAVVGFAADLLQLNSQSLGRGFFWPALFGRTRENSRRHSRILGLARKRDSRATVARLHRRRVVRSQSRVENCC